MPMEENGGGGGEFGEWFPMVRKQWIIDIFTTAAGA